MCNILHDSFCETLEKKEGVVFPELNTYVNIETLRIYLKNKIFFTSPLDVSMQESPPI